MINHLVTAFRLLHSDNALLSLYALFVCVTPKISLLHKIIVTDVRMIIVSSNVITEILQCPNRTTKGCVTEYTLQLKLSFRYTKRKLSKNSGKDRKHYLTVNRMSKNIYQQFNVVLLKSVVSVCSFLAQFQS